MKSLVIAAIFVGAVGFAAGPGVAFAAPTDNGCAHIGTLAPGGNGEPAIECQKVDDPANPRQWVVIPTWWSGTRVRQTGWGIPTRRWG
jgi:hypothetical protein